jgi:hypothetical protein
MWKEIRGVLPQLITAAYAAADANLPAFCWEDSEIGDKPSGHWSGTLAAIEEAGGEITPALITILSLSRFFGPTPLLSPRAGASLMRWVFPNRNDCGGWAEWESLAETLLRLQEDPKRYFQYIRHRRIAHLSGRHPRTLYTQESSWSARPGRQTPGDQALALAQDDWDMWSQEIATRGREAQDRYNRIMAG